MANHLTLAVAGSRKTQGLVEHCAALAPTRRVLVVTFTQRNQHELSVRLAKRVGMQTNVEVMGWYTLLIRHFARPFLPFVFPGSRVQGFDFEGQPSRFATEEARFFNPSGALYAAELGKLSNLLVEQSQGALLYRLESLYDEILVDEVQDLSGWDWELLEKLFASRIDIRMVGDIRQSVLSTSPRSRKNKQYAYARALTWFLAKQRRGEIEIEFRNTTWRCSPGIARFSDTIFNPAWGFPETESLNETTTDHDGVFLLAKCHVLAYVERFRPQCLRVNVRSGAEFDLNYINFKVAKGATYERVLIIATGPIATFLQRGIQLDPGPAATFYVAVTRAQQSVAIVLDRPGQSVVPYWAP
ncbi:UvrD-helicase domain-containing protein [Pseudomonas sp. WS 5071]|uniref:UvrD-helicase domain-containing protein n=1 Tax=Pseudomonas sp. WS 5071 TaxID=2717479 RepID=UPI001474C381|nr:UvrD-helicase domain-containing protein [Pseudomonas sp. WS 5071]NMY76987.1 UvrD-helicase domain-containing protein [Pseudomonas sp. WS 5071]